MKLDLHNNFFSWLSDGNVSEWKMRLFILYAFTYSTVFLPIPEHKKDFPIKISTPDSPVPLLYWLYPYLAFMYLLYSFSPKVFTNFISFLLQNPDFIFSPFLSFLVSFLHFHRIFFFTCPFHNFSKWFLCTDICICFSYSPWRNIEHNCFLTRNNISMGLAFSLCSRFSKNFVHGCGW